MSNKKSQIEDWLPLFGIIVVLLMVLAYISYFNLKSGRDQRERINSQIIVKDSGQLLLNYLNGPLGSKYPGVNIAEGMSMYYADKDNEILIQLNVVSEIFFSKSSLETDYSTWSIEINHKDDRIVIEPQKAKTQQILRKEVARTAIPTHYGNLIEVNLFIVTTRFAS